MDNLSLLEVDNGQKGEIAVLGVPSGLGADREGGNVTGDAPDYLRTHGLEGMLKFVGFDVHDQGDIDATLRESTSVEKGEGVKNVDEVVRIAEETAGKVAEQIGLGRRILAIGGDHSMSMGTILGASATLKGDIGVIWIDAHADANDSVDLSNPDNREAGTTGNAHGMPVRVITGLHSNQKFKRLVDKFQGIDPENVLLVGMKDLDPGEISLLRREGFNVVTMDDINTVGGIEPVTNEILKLRAKVANIWVDLDIDGLDESVAPATPMPNDSGITGHHIRSMFKFIGKTCNNADTQVAGMGIAELMPSADVDNKTAKLVLELVASAYGGRYTEFDKYLANPSGVAKAKNPGNLRARFASLGGRAKRNVGKLAIAAILAAMTLPGIRNFLMKPEPTQDPALRGGESALALGAPSGMTSLDATWSADPSMMAMRGFENVVDVFENSHFREIVTSLTDEKNSKEKGGDKDRLFAELNTMLYIALLRSDNEAEKTKLFALVMDAFGGNQENYTDFLMRHKSFVNGLGDQHEAHEWMGMMGFLPSDISTMAT